MQAEEVTTTWFHRGGGWIDFTLQVGDRSFIFYLSDAYDSLPDLASWICRSKTTDASTLLGIDQEGRDGFLALRPAEEAGHAWLQIFEDTLERPIAQVRVNRIRFLKDLGESLAAFLRSHPELDRWPLDESEWRPYRERILSRLKALPSVPPEA